MGARPKLLASCLVAILMWLAAAGGAFAAKRVALVIGESKYKNTSPLPNPANDAEDVAHALRDVGFEVIFKLNAEKRDMDTLLAQFARASRDSEASLFYYAGHGMQYQGRNYLMPVDAELEDEVSLRYQMVSLDDIKSALDRSPGVKIMVLDACRNNPMAERFVRSISTNTRDIGAVRGFTRPEQVRGMVVAYATQADDTAQDGAGRNSPFTRAFVGQLKEPGLEIGAMFRRIASDVYNETKGRQVPELSISLLNDYYLNQAETDRTIWSRIRTSSDPDTMREFLTRFPNSFFAPDAKLRLEYLDRALPEKQAAVDREKQKAVDAERQAKEQAERERVEAEAARREKDLAARLAAAEAERVRMASELAQREKERADAELRQKSEREKAEAALRDREKELREQLEREKAAASTRDRERLVQEKLEADRKKTSDEEKQAAAKLLADKQARDREAQEAAQQAQKLKAEIERLQAEAKKASEEAAAARAKAQAGAATQVASAAPTSAPSSLTADQIALVKPIQGELKRVGCYAGGDSDWTSAAMQRSIKSMARYAKLAAPPDMPSKELLDDLKSRQARLCPLVCSPRQEESNGRCVAKTCAKGEYLDSDGDCVAKPVAKAKPKPEPKPKTEARRPVERAERPVAQTQPARGGGRCFNFNGRQYCE